MLNSDMSGLTLASEIRRYRAARALPLILMDMLGRPDVPSGSAEGDYQAVLHKPVKLHQLQPALISVFEGRSYHANPLAKRAQGGDWTVDEQMPRILLAEDDTINQQVIRHMLQQLGYQIEIVRDGDLALAAIEQRHYDVVLLDVQMPSMDGLEVAQTIRQRYSPDWQPYLVAVTANASEGAREECLSAGMDDYISKPIQVAELIKVIEMHRLRVRAVSGDSSLGETPLPADRPFVDDPTGQLADLVERFLDDTADLLNIMRSAAALGDVRAIQRAAHRLKSSSALVGAMILSELCDRLERAIRTHTPIDLREQVQLIDVEFARVKSSLSA
jgi:CheY-like chemotaxis protein